MTKKKQHYGLAVDLISSIGNDAMLDITLETNDGGQVLASRFVLGARSTVLQRLLFGELSWSGRIQLNYSTNVVRTLVHYCRTNELDQIWHTKDEAAARELVKLCDCANSFELKGLQELVSDMVASLTKTHPYLACAIYDEASAYGESVNMLKGVALNAIRLTPEAALLRGNEFGDREPGIASLGPAVVEEIVGDPRMCAEEISMFRAVAVWADAKTTNTSSHREIDDSVKQLQERREVARELVKKTIDLSKIAPSELLGVVSDSGLVDAMSVSNALIQLALRVEKEGVVLSKRRALNGVSSNAASAAASPALSSPRQRPEKQPRPPTQDENSVVVDDVSIMTGFTNDSTTRRHSNRKKKKQKKPAAAIVTPRREARGAAAASTSAEGRTFQQAVGLFLADKIDSMCIHPGGHTTDITKNN